MSVGTGWTRESTRTLSGPVDWILSENGKQLGVGLGDRRRRIWELRKIMSGDDWDTLLATYQASQLTSGCTTVELEDAQETGTAGLFDVFFTAAPRREYLAPNLYQVTIALVEADATVTETVCT